jgi:hypothetical protein
MRRAYLRGRPGRGSDLAMLWEERPGPGAPAGPARANYDIIQICFMFDPWFMIQLMDFQHMLFIPTLCRESRNDMKGLERVFHNERERLFEYLFGTSPLLKAVLDVKAQTHRFPRPYRTDSCCQQFPECLHAARVSSGRSKITLLTVSAQACIFHCRCLSKSCTVPCICPKLMPDNMRQLAFTFVTDAVRVGATVNHPDGGKAGRSVVTLKLMRKHVYDVSLRVVLKQCWTPQPNTDGYVQVVKHARFKVTNTSTPHVQRKIREGEGLIRGFRDVITWDHFEAFIDFVVGNEFKPRRSDARPRV